MDFSKIARIGLGVMLTGAGITHLTVARNEFKAQVPDWVPLQKDDTVLLSGVAEIMLGLLALTAGEKRKNLSGIAMAAFFTAIFPGNIAQWVDHRDAFSLDTDQKRFARLFMQPVLVYLALKSRK